MKVTTNDTHFQKIAVQLQLHIYVTVTTIYVTVTTPLAKLIFWLLVGGHGGQLGVLIIAPAIQYAHLL